MFVCVTGMHRSGTSMVTRLLGACGVGLGDPEDMLPPAGDNPEGFWEHRDFVDVNVQLLDRLGGAWDLPPVPPVDWGASPDLLPLRTRAAALLARFASERSFAWKDPRNSLTLGFWRALVPDLRVLVCLRNPLAAAHSLQVRAGCSEAFGLALWRAYHERILAAVGPAQRVVTHYESYFHDPAAELRRVCGALGLAPSDEQLERAVATVRADLRHHQGTTVQVLDHVRPPEVADLYMRLGAEAGPVFQNALAAERVGPGPEPDALPGTSGSWLRAVLRARVARLEADAVAHAAALEVLHAERDVTAATLAGRERELAEATTALQATRAALHDFATTLAVRDRELATLRQEARDLGWRLDAITSSRAWRVMAAWWRLRGTRRPAGPPAERSGALAASLGVGTVCGEALDGREGRPGA